MTVTSLEAASDLAADDASAVLGEMVVDSVRFPVAALIGALDGGSGADAELIGSLVAGRSYAELRSMLLLACDVADKAKAAKGCGINPGLAAANAKRMAEARHKAREYAWLRDGNVIPDVAAERVGVTSEAGRSEYETAYQHGKRQREESAA
jgi:hypothetical protein